MLHTLDVFDSLSTRFDNNLYHLIIYLYSYLSIICFGHFNLVSFWYVNINITNTPLYWSSVTSLTTCDDVEGRNAGDCSELDNRYS